VSPITGSVERLLLPIGPTFVELGIRVVEPTSAPVATIFCIHDFDGNGLDFVSLARHFGERDCRVVLPDMPGRGASAALPPDVPSLPGQVAALRAVFSHYPSHQAVVVACGWGAAIALAALAAAVPGLRGFVATDMPLDYSVDGDPLIGHVRANSGRAFESESAACRAVLQSPAFVASGLSEADVSHRVRQEEAGFRFNYDDRIGEAAGQFSAARFDLPEAMRRLPCSILLLSARRADGAASDGRPLPRPEVSNLRYAEVDTPGSRILLRDAGLSIVEEFVATLIQPT
jgi:pimeloyl-ACP methyl ester carboxylesterase